MKFEIETDTLRAHGERGLNGRWTSEVLQILDKATKL